MSGRRPRLCISYVAARCRQTNESDKMRDGGNLGLGCAGKPPAIDQVRQGGQGLPSTSRVQLGSGYIPGGSDAPCGRCRMHIGHEGSETLLNMFMTLRVSLHSNSLQDRSRQRSKPRTWVGSFVVALVIYVCDRLRNIYTCTCGLKWFKFPGNSALQNALGT